MKVCKKSDEDVEDPDEDVFCSIAVTKYMLYLGFNSVGMNPQHPNLQHVILYYVHLPAQHVNKFSFKSKLWITMKVIAFRSHIVDRLSGENNKC